VPAPSPGEPHGGAAFGCLLVAAWADAVSGVEAGLHSLWIPVGIASALLLWTLAAMFASG
jgi:hypothetical protein